MTAAALTTTDTGTTANPSKWLGRVRLANVGDLDTVLPLFEAYREFYKAQKDEARARHFLLGKV